MFNSVIVVNHESGDDMKATQVGTENQSNNHHSKPQRKSKKVKLAEIRSKRAKRGHFLETYRGKTPWDTPRSIFWNDGGAIGHYKIKNFIK